MKQIEKEVKTKEECLQMMEQITDYINDKCDKNDIYTLHHLENYVYEIERFIRRRK